MRAVMARAQACADAVERPARRASSLERACFMTQPGNVLFLPGRRRGGWLPAGAGGKALWALLLVAAAALRFHGLARESFWIDEVFSARIVEGPIRQVIDRIPNDKPPLDYYVQALFAGLGDPNKPEFWHRFPEALAGVALVVGIYFWALAWLGRRVALVAFTLAALNPYLIYYSQNARPYSLFNALFVWQQVAFAWWLRRRRRGEGGWAPWAALAALSILMLYTLYVAVVIFAAMGLFLLVAPGAGRRAVRSRWRAAGAFLAIMALALLAVWPLYGHVRIRDPYFYWRFEPLTLLLLARFAAEQSCFNTSGATMWIGATALVTLTALGAWACRRRRAAMTLFVLLSLIPLPVTIAFYALIDRSYWTRYTSYCLPGWLLLDALGLRLLAKWAWPWFRPGRPAPHSVRGGVVEGLALLFALAGGALALKAFYAGKPYNADWRGATRYVVEHARPGDATVVLDSADAEHLRYYLDRNGASSRIRLMQQDSPERAAWHGPVWGFFPRFGSPDPHQSGVCFTGITVEHLGATPDAALLVQLSKGLGPGPTLMPGNCSADLLGDGWSPVETWGKDFSLRWATRNNAILWLPLTGSGAGRLTISLMPYTYPGSSPQRLQPSFGGQKLDARDAPPGKFSELSWDVPAGLARPGFNQIELEFAWVHSPSQEIKNSFDRRALAAAIVWIRWEELATPAATTNPSIGAAAGRH
jgi:hypothetical protein